MYSEAIQEFSAKMEALSKTLMKLIVLSLGFDKSSEYYESFFEKSTESTLRLISYVPPTNRQSSAIVLPSHTDFSFLTILYHDIPAGLEVQNKEGDWLRVKPVASSTTAFAVNLGDAFEVNKIVLGYKFLYSFFIKCFSICLTVKICTLKITLLI